MASPKSYKLATVNSNPERAKMIVGKVIEAVKDQYTIVHAANAESEYPFLIHRLWIIRCLLIEPHRPRSSKTIIRGNRTGHRSKSSSPHSQYTSTYLTHRSSPHQCGLPNKAPTSLRKPERSTRTAKPWQYRKACKLRKARKQWWSGSRGSCRGYLGAD